jgi:hypothetical protein
MKYWQSIIHNSLGAAGAGEGVIRRHRRVAFRPFLPRCAQQQSSGHCAPYCELSARNEQYWTKPPADGQVWLALEAVNG